ncbi:MAG: DUF4861 family protein [Cyclobacteriaceae bacterium]
MKLFTKIFQVLIISFFILQSCSSPQLSVKLKNDLDIDRTEIISVQIGDIQNAGIKNLDNIELKNQNGESLVTQITASNELLFQASIGPKTEVAYTISENPEKKEIESSVSTFSRFVPERIDDYAWENDRVAFRTYGPEAQRLDEENLPGKTLSSGMDCWLKKVDYPIIDKWYKQDKEGKSYHKDHGEGLDNYHVGPSRGCGGITLFVKDTFYTSKNFQKWERIDVGPLRTSFKLAYDPWDAGGITVNEEKNISLDLGSNLMKIELDLKTSDPIAYATVGVAIHDSTATTSVSEKYGWFNVSSPHADSELSTAVLLTPIDVDDFETVLSPIPDKSHLYVHGSLNQGKLTYYAGFTWKKSKQFATDADWEAYLSEYTNRLESPIKVSLE